MLAESEQLIQAAVSELLKDRTTFVISTITHADLIVVIDEGKLIESGTHEQLIASGGHCADMIRRQSDAVTVSLSYN